MSASSPTDELPYPAGEAFEHEGTLYFAAPTSASAPVHSSGHSGVQLRRVPRDTDGCIDPYGLHELGNEVDGPVGDGPVLVWRRR